MTLKTARNSSEQLSIVLDTIAMLSNGMVLCYLCVYADIFEGVIMEWFIEYSSVVLILLIRLHDSLGIAQLFPVESRDGFFYKCPSMDIRLVEHNKPSF